MLALLGQHLYVERYIVDIIIKFYDKTYEHLLKKYIKQAIEDKNGHSHTIYHLIDLCIECNLIFFSYSELAYIVETYRNDYDVVSNVLDYLETYKHKKSLELITNMVQHGYPDQIYIQMLHVIHHAYSFEKMEQFLFENPIDFKENNLFISHYIEFLRGNYVFKKEGISIMQSMFYGDFTDSGKGDTGGLSVLLKNLGDEIAKDQRVSSIFTIVIPQHLSLPFITYYHENHILIRIPIYLDHTTTDSFVKRELFVKRFITTFLKKADIHPNIFHVRYLDNASKAVAYVSKKIGSKLVATLTPDPHRNMIDENGELILFTQSELIEKLNKIMIGDELIDISDGLIGIGSNESRAELEQYFPQLKQKELKDKKTITMIGEGIEPNQLRCEDGHCKSENELIGITHTNKEFFDKPIILNVGRLSTIKGQIELLQAYGNSPLSTTHNLLIIGGDIKNPNQEEKEFIEFFKKYLHLHPYLKAKVSHVGALPNEEIRIIEKSIIRKEFDYPHIYLCSSIKEEFGISILEAMSEGFLIVAPSKGGVKSYIEHTVNGFLIDTSNWQTIAKEVKEYIYDSKIESNTFRKIQMAGKERVQNIFSIHRIAQEFLHYYLSLQRSSSQ